MPSLENKVVTHITLYVDASTQNRPPYVYAKQYDANSRYLVVRIMDSNKGIVVTGAAQLNATKPDGTHSYITGTANEDGTVTIGLTPNLLAVEGKISCDITVFDSADGDQVLLTTSTFFILVDKSNYDSDAIESKDDFSSAGEKIDDLILKQEGDENKLFLAYQGETIGEGVVLPATGGGLNITDDGSGNVTIETVGSNISITDDGNGNVVIQ